LWPRDRIPYNPVIVSERARVSAVTTLASIVERAAQPHARAWFADALAAARNPNGLTELQSAWSATTRRMGGKAGAVRTDEAAALESCGLRGAEAWPLDRVARTALVCEAARATPDAAAVVETLYRTSDNGERVALLGALGALPDADRFIATAVSACRTNVTSVFEAIACDNPYPARHFSDEAFNQMVMKTLFLGVPVARIEGLRARVNAELGRMVADYASERRAAGRSVPADVDVILNLEAAAP
jgi:hypothetical protein